MPGRPDIGSSGKTATFGFREIGLIVQRLTVSMENIIIITEIM